MRDWERVLGGARFDSKDPRLRSAVSTALSRFPRGELPLRSVTKIQQRRRGRMKGLVGLTVYSLVEQGKKSGKNRQRITFYTDLLDRLSDRAAVGVVAHELAHAWLNEHISPEASRKREGEADELARKWGYGVYLEALEAETVEETA